MGGRISEKRKPARGEPARGESRNSRKGDEKEEYMEYKNDNEN